MVGFDFDVNFDTNVYPELATGGKLITLLSCRMRSVMFRPHSGHICGMFGFGGGNLSWGLRAAKFRVLGI